MLHRGILSGGFATHAPQQSSRRCPVVASMGGRGGFGDSGLILGPNGNPMGGRGGPGGGPNRLIIPGAPGSGFNPQQSRQAPVGVDEPASGPGQLPPAHKYRPPPGFMGDNVQDPSLNTQDPQALISKLRSNAGHWHQLGKLLPILYSKGIDNNMVAELTGINPADQNSWIVAGTVYDSIAAGGKVDASVLAYFDSDGEGEKLSPFRFLPAERRVAAAEYIVKKDLDIPACDTLARAMKEWDRRRGERTGFNNSPGDCMAFKYLRDAIECRSARESAEKLALAFAEAVSETAVARLTDWQETELAERSGTAGGAPSSSRARLSVLRLQQDELGFRPLPQISSLSEATVDELQWAPRTSQEGAFGAFELQAGGQPGQKWVALPQWKALALARHPVAIPLLDCAKDPAVLAASRAKTEEEKKKLTGVGLLVVDTEGSTSRIDPDAYYIVAAPPGSGQQLQLIDGTQLQSMEGTEVLASVLFLARPPNRESSITSAELLQL